MFLEVMVVGVQYVPGARDIWELTILRVPDVSGD